MIMKNIYTVYFSPTGGTKKVATVLSDNLSQLLHIPSQSIDLTLPANRQISYPFDFDSLVILAVLIYAGRIPNKLLPDLEKCLNGNGKTAIIPVSVYVWHHKSHAFPTFHYVLLLSFNSSFLFFYKKRPSKSLYLVC